MRRAIFSTVVNTIMVCLFLCALVSPCTAHELSNVQFMPVNSQQEIQKIQEINECNAITKARRAGMAYIALIIDDMGPAKLSEKFIALDDVPLTLSFLPYAVGLKTQTQLAHDKGHEIMLHMPMQPFADKPREKYMIMGHDSAETAQKKLDAALAQFPKALVRGVNNHMGSLVTSKAEVINAVLMDIKKRGLFFVDSKTTPRSVAEDVAYGEGIPAIGRDVFLDDVNDKKDAAYRLSKTFEKAKGKGYAVVIGHPLKKTYAAIERFITNRPANLEFVNISQIIKIRDCLNEDKQNDKKKLSSSNIMLDDVEAVSYEVNAILKELYQE